MLGLDTRSLLASSLPPTFVHAARPLPLPAAAFHAEAAASSSAGSRHDGILRTFRPSTHDDGSGAAAAGGAGAVVLRTPVPAFSPPGAASSASRTGGEKRRREDGGAGGSGGSLADVISLLDAIRGDVASLAGRVAGVEEAVLLGASRRL